MEQTLARCAETPDERAIHHVRTGSRRVDAALDALERETGKTAEMRKSAAKLRKLLKKVRHRAGKVRDLDVHRGLLRKLDAEGEAAAGVEVRQEIAALDRELEQQRERRAVKFQQKAGGWRSKLERRSEALLHAAQEAGDPPAQSNEAELALVSFAGLCREIPVLELENLHDFRKGAKHARYLAEGGEDERSRRIAKRLKRVQDTIGVWHDWLELTAEAQEAAGGRVTELVQRLEAKRERELRSALKTTERVRLELLSEWEHWPRGRAESRVAKVKSALKKTA
jgi:CHAD domain-containing protein